MADDARESEPKKRGRPRKFEPDEALETLRGAFAARGYAEASMDDLTAASGSNRPSLYAAFGDKEAIYLKTLSLYGDKLRAFVEQARAAEGPIEEKLGAFFSLYADHCCAGAPAPGCMIAGAAAAAHHGVVAERARALRAEWLSALRVLFAESLARRELPAEPRPELRAQWALAIAESIGQRARLGESAEALAAFAQDSLAVIAKV